MIFDFPNFRGFSLDFLEIVKEFWVDFLTEVEFHLDISLEGGKGIEKWDFQEKVILQFIFSPAALFELYSASLRGHVSKIANE